MSLQIVASRISNHFVFWLDPTLPCLIRKVRPWKVYQPDILDWAVLAEEDIGFQ